MIRCYRIPFSTNVERIALAAGHKDVPIEWLSLGAMRQAGIQGPQEFTLGQAYQVIYSPNRDGSVGGEIEFAGGTLDWDMVQRFRNLSDLNLGRLRERVQTCLVSSDSVLLSQILRRFPPCEGILEVIGYLVLALQDSIHHVADDHYSHVQLSIDGTKAKWRVPVVLFARAQ